MVGKSWQRAANLLAARKEREREREREREKERRRGECLC
jgi:hypothetical protein